MGRRRNGDVMPDGTAAAATPARSPAGRVLAILRFIAMDRVGILGLFWLLVAFVVRPALMAAHAGAPSPMLAGLASDPASLARLVGTVQWLSMMLPIGIAAIVHLRLPALTDAAAIARRAFLMSAVYAGLLCVGYLVFVWTPVTYLSMITRDSFIFFDAIYRIGLGERPHVDFPTALGAATLYLPWLGSVMSGGYAGAIELISAPITLFMGLACAYAGMRRFPGGVTAALVVLIFLVAVPTALLGLWYDDTHTIVDGRPVVLADTSTYAMFYNRWGWSVLVALLCFLAPRQPQPPESDISQSRTQLIETLILAALLAFLFYLKVTYFMVGCAAAVLYAYMNANPIRTLATGVGATVGLVLIVGLPTGLLIPYINDLAFVASINAGKSDTLLAILSGNAAAILLALSPLGLLAALGQATWKDAAIGVFLTLTSIFLVVQNAQLFDMVTLACLAAYGVARVWTSDNRIARLAVIGAFALTVMPVMLDRALGLIQQTSGARREEIRPPAAWASIPAMRGVHLAEREDMFESVAAAATDNQLIDAWTFSNQMKRRDGVRQGEYMASLMAGMSELRAVMKPGESVASIEMTNPFPFLMGVRPAKGSYLTLDGDRTFNTKVYPDPAIMLADADHVMIPRQSGRTPDIANHVYREWLAQHYEARVESLYWVRYSHRKTAPGATTQAALIP